MKRPSRSGIKSTGRPLKNQALQEGRKVVFVDESGLYLLPAVVQTYAPVAHTPMLHRRLTPDA